jgi:hypothetical protein
MTEGWEVGLAATKLGPPVPPGRLVRRSRLDAAVAGGSRLIGNGGAIVNVASILPMRA